MFTNYSVAAKENARLDRWPLASQPATALELRLESARNLVSYSLGGKTVSKEEWDLFISRGAAESNPELNNNR